MASSSDTAFRDLLELLFPKRFPIVAQVASSDGFPATCFHVASRPPIVWS